MRYGYLSGFELADGESLHVVGVIVSVLFLLVTSARFLRKEERVTCLLFQPQNETML